MTLFTGALAVLGFLQWRTLEKTDHTARSGQRAFVFVKQSNDHWTTAWQEGGTIQRSFYIEWENNGNTQTRDMKVMLFCPRPSVFDTADPITSKSVVTVAASRLLGPKQSVW